MLYNGRQRYYTDVVSADVKIYNIFDLYIYIQTYIFIYLIIYDHVYVNNYII